MRDREDERDRGDEGAGEISGAPDSEGNNKEVTTLSLSSLPP